MVCHGVVQIWTVVVLSVGADSMVVANSVATKLSHHLQIVTLGTAPLGRVTGLHVIGRRIWNATACAGAGQCTVGETPKRLQR